MKGTTKITESSWKGAARRHLDRAAGRAAERGRLGEIILVEGSWMRGKR